MKITLILKLCPLLLILLGCGSGSTQSPSDDLLETYLEGPVLFKDFKYGQPLANYQSSDLFEDCSSDSEKILCASEEVKFLGNMYFCGLNFNDEKLNSVILSAAYSDQLLTQVMGSLPANNFMPVYMLFGTQTMDMIAGYKKNNLTDLQNMIAGNLLTLYQQNRLEEFSMILVDVQTFAGPDGKFDQSIGSYSELLNKASDIQRFIEISIEYAEDEDQYYLNLNFLLKQSIIKTETF